MKILEKKSNYNDIDYKTINNIKSLLLDVLNDDNKSFSYYNFTCSYLIYLLYTKYLNYDINNKLWINNDKFYTNLNISALIKSVEFMCNIITLEELKNKIEIRKRDLPYAVGNELKKQYLKQKYMISKRKSLVNYNTYFLCEISSLKSSLYYETLNYVIDNNLSDLIILCMTPSLNKKDIELFKLNNWHVGSTSFDNLDTIEYELSKANKSTKPSIIFIETNKENEVKTLYLDYVKQMKDKLNIRDIPYTVYDETKSHIDSIVLDKNKKIVSDWNKLYLKNKDKFLELNEEIEETKKDYVINKINKSFILDLKGDILTDYLEKNNKYFLLKDYKSIVEEISLSLNDEVVSILSMKDVFYLLNEIKESAIINKHNLYIVNELNYDEKGFDKTLTTLSLLRNIPNLVVYRCFDEKEFIGAYLSYLKHESPCVIVISNDTFVERSKTKIDEVDKGCYLIKKETKPQGILIATGKEVDVALEVSKRLKGIGINVNVVSMVSLEKFLSSDIKYKQKTLPDIPKAVIEFYSSSSWYILGLNDKQICGINKYFDSQNKENLEKHYKISTEDIYNKVKKLFS